MEISGRMKSLLGDFNTPLYFHHFIFFRLWCVDMITMCSTRAPIFTVGQQLGWAGIGRDYVLGLLSASRPVTCDDNENNWSHRVWYSIRFSKSTRMYDTRRYKELH